MAETSASPRTAPAAGGAFLLADALRSSPTAAAGAEALLGPAVASRPSKAAAPDLDQEFGFQRPDFRKEKLAGTVEFHHRHLFLFYKGPEDGPPHVVDVEANESDRLRRVLDAAIEARKPNLKKSIKLTICEGEDGTESSLGDVLIFPDMIRYRGLTRFGVDNFVEQVLVKDVEWLPGCPEAITGSYVFVCAHGGTDKRCSVCGPALITRFKEEIEGQGLDGQVSVSACSHVGGHKYAGNVIIFSSDAKGEVTGHWYGYVAPDDVPVLLHKHIEQGEIVDHLWRGQLGMTEEQQKKKALELKKKKKQLDLDLSLETVTQALIETSNRPAGNSSGSTLMKLQAPEHFDGDAILSGYELHRFSVAKELQDIVNRAKTWLPGKLSLALLMNGNLFAIKGSTVSDVLFQDDGAVCVFEREQVAEVVLKTDLYTRSSTPLKEHLPEISPVSGTGMRIIKSEFGGKEWTRRKYSIEGDEAYYVFQWLPKDSKTKPKPQGMAKVKAIGKKKQIEEEVPALAAVEAPTTYDFSIKNCIFIVNQISDLSDDEKAKAYNLFRNEVNREIFVSAHPAVRPIWLRNQMALPD